MWQNYIVHFSFFRVTQEEQRSDARKKNLLILMLHHLVQEGYSEAAKALEAESNLCFNKFEVCDNVDLETVLMVLKNLYCS